MSGFSDTALALLDLGQNDIRDGFSNNSGDKRLHGNTLKRGFDPYPLVDLLGQIYVNLLCLCLVFCHRPFSIYIRLRQEAAADK